MAALDDLLDAIFDGKKSPFYSEFEGWVRESRRFRAFATTYQGKIRAKVRHVRDAEGMQDLAAELETAMLLLREERFTVEYEKYAASKQRGPDFTVTFKAHTPFNIEVRRIRGGDQDEPKNGTGATRIMEVLCDKVGQMQPGAVNLLWLVAEHDISETDLSRGAATLRQLAEHKAEDFFTKRGFESAADFLKQYRQMSGLVLRQPAMHAVWHNTLARHAVPSPIAAAIQRLLWSVNSRP